jgi:hypothetical protein
VQEFHNDVTALKALFQSFFSGIPYNWFVNNQIADYEGFYASVFYRYFAGRGFAMAGTGNVLVA